jgi:hypothetical protein
MEERDREREREGNGRELSGREARWEEEERGS